MPLNMHLIAAKNVMGLNNSLLVLGNVDRAQIIPVSIMGHTEKLGEQLKVMPPSIRRHSGQKSKIYNMDKFCLTMRVFLYV